jgi:aminopeptidase N
LNPLPDFGARNFSRITRPQFISRTFRHMSTTTTEPARVAVETFRKDYTPVPHTIDTVALKFVLNDDQTEVTSTMKLKPLQPMDASGQRRSLRLNGRSDVRLVSIAINSVPLPADAYVLTSDSLTLPPSTLPETDSWELTIVTVIKPHENTLLEGLYHSSGAFCTQCEAEGFRGITFFLDRPDVMSTYTVRIEGDATKLPVMLSNGNLTGQGSLPGGRHFTEWTDPFRKPCYLFALVAGDLAMSSDTFVTASGRKVDLRIFVEHCNIDKVAFAMQSLKRSMKWDEDTFGLEYDLDLFNIVAVSDFNMGAMENKSLNIFNSRLILATPNTASDMDFNRIESVVGHEYFHNWTGDRVTCRDWFQLTLKEGLTVYRDQEFTSDLNSRPVKRIEDVVRLRASQFAEDGGPMAHPIRPDSYIKMDNFYTLTVYEKGAEVIRMYEAILGKAGFRKGMDLYFKRHDGQAVTCDDFRAAMADANGEDLTALGLWYGQAGTPRLQVEQMHNSEQGTFTLRFKQHTPPSAGQPTKVPVLIPVRMALLGADGALLPLRLNGRDVGTETVLRVTQAEQEFVFESVGAVKPTPVRAILFDFVVSI